jgi:sulfite reductase beta subunit-like hemoprotein
MSAFEFKRPTLIGLFICLVVLCLSPTAGAQSTPAEAADEARKRTGGKVIWVKGSKGNYQVRVMMPNGQLRHVKIRDKSQANKKPGK